MADFDDDFRVYCAFFEHEKTGELEALTGELGVLALIRLWAWVREHRPNGDLAGISDTVIELRARWRGMPGAFVAALDRVKFLVGADLTRRVHNWAKWQPWAIGAPKRAAKSKKAAKKRWEEEAKRGKRTRNNNSLPSNATSMPVASTEHATSNAPSMPDASSEHARSNRPAPAPAPAPSDSPPGSHSNSTAASPAVPFPWPVFPCSGVSKRPTWELSEEQISQWRPAFPAVDVKLECRKAHAWCVANPKDRKSFGGMARFLTRWLGKCQDRGMPSNFTPSPYRQPQRSSGQAIYEEALNIRSRAGPNGSSGPIIDVGGDFPTMLPPEVKT